MEPMCTTPTRRPGPAANVILTGEFDDVSWFNCFPPAIDPFSGTRFSVETIHTSRQDWGLIHWDWYVIAFPLMRMRSVSCMQPKSRMTPLFDTS